MNLEHIKLELQELTNKVNEIEKTQNNGTISFTKEELKKLINSIQEQTMEYVEKELRDISLQFEDYVELELCGFEISVNFDNYTMARDIADNIEGPEEASDEDIDALLVDFNK